MKFEGQKALTNPELQPILDTYYTIILTALYKDMRSRLWSKVPYLRYLGEG
jgi:hypothetical protein